MICSRPMYALDLGYKENGKRNIKILPKRFDLYSKKQLEARYGSGDVIPLPCGKCLACRINHAKEWAVRCVLESLCHEDNYFITLTYDDEHLPEDGQLHREHIREFQKKIWKKYPGVRFFGCGEYGSNNLRPHYHMIAFGLSLQDFQPIGKGLSESKTITEMWPYGFNYIGEVNYSTCNYVAQYCIKKTFKEVKEKTVKEFTFMSNRPGIGNAWVHAHLPSVLKYGQVFGQFGSSNSASLPRYFEKVAEALDGEAYKEFKKIRLDKGNSLQLNEMLNHCITEVELLNAYKEENLIHEFARQKKGQRL